MAARWGNVEGKVLSLETAAMPIEVLLYRSCVLFDPRMILALQHYACCVQRQRYFAVYDLEAQVLSQQQPLDA